MGGESDALLNASARKDALARLRIDHQRMTLRGLTINELMTDEIEGVEHAPRLRVVNFEMKMWSRRGTGIPADGYELPLCNGKFKGTEMKLALGRMPGILLLADKGSYLGSETLQVAIDAGVAFGVMHINGIAKAKHPNGNHRHIASADGKDGLAFYPTRLDVDTTMEMVGTRFAEVSCQHHLIIDGRSILRKRGHRNFFCRQLHGGSHQQKE